MTATATVGSPPLAGRRALFVSWVRHHGRSEELAAALGAECAFVAVGTLRDRRTAPARHLWQALVTGVLLLRRRPQVLVVMAPPALLVLLGLVWARATGAQLVVDCHSKAVLGRPLSARLARRATLALATLPSLAESLGRAVVLHDPPARAVPAPRHDEVVFPAGWAPDEPVEDLLEAALLLPGTRFAVTGTPPAGLVLPPNVRATGHLPRAEFLALVAGAPVVLALTTREDTMQRAAYEAVAAGRPVVASGTAALRGYLGDAACYADGNGPSLAAALTRALAELPRLEAEVLAVRQAHEAAFAQALADVEAALA